jgi:hypothetical protein
MYLCHHGEDANGGNEERHILLGEVHHQPEIDEETRVLQ